MSIRFTVISTEAAHDRLMELWMAADSDLRDAITGASHAIDQELREDAHLKGVSMGQVRPGLRRLSSSPLRVYYLVSEPDRLAQIRDYRLVPPIP